MATYYVRTDGNNSNVGTGSGTGQAWATVAHALGGTGTASGVTGGDTIYIAPGKYAGLTIAVAPSSLLNVIGDPSGAQFGYTIAPGPVHISNVLDRVSGIYTHAITATSKDYINLKNLVIGGITTSACHNWIIDSCHSYSASSTNVALSMTFTANVNANTVIKNSTFYLGSYNSSPVVITFNAHSTTYTSSFRIENVSLVANQSTGDIFITCANATDIVLSNIYGLKTISITGTVANQAKIINSIISNLTGSVGGNLVEDYNIFTLRTGVNRTNVAAGLNSVVVNAPLIYGDTMAQTGAGAFSTYQPPSTVFNQLVGYGTTTDAPATDYFGNAYGTPMTIGIAKSATLTGVGVYSATERNVSVITTSPGSINQTVELYLGVTGVTSATNGLRASYARSRSAAVSIPLVPQTTTGAWISGGFCEISASTMPGMYRLDVPNAAFADGADNVTIFVSGASGTNGAVQTVNLEYPNASVLRMGPYKLISNHMGADNPLEVLKSVQAPVDVQLVDNSGGGIDITGATVTAKVYNASSQLIDTYTCTPTYALDGRCSFNLDTTVTDNSGHYTVTVTRQVGGNIVVFGPLRCLVRAN